MRFFPFSSLLPRIAFFFVIALLWVNSASAVDLSGSWSGYWQSDVTRHHGPLQCTFTRIDDASYQADFSGRFFRVIPFRYSVVLNVVSDGDTVTLTGENYLGRRYGTFTYTAEATRDQFTAAYSSCKDDGEFVLTRCCCK